MKESRQMTNDSININEMTMKININNVMYEAKENVEIKRQ